MISTLYLVPTYHCNLNCRHCSVRTQAIKYDEDKFIDVFKQQQYAKAILFGGEPLSLNNNKIKHILESNTVNSISTNLLLLDDIKLQLIKENKLDVATSWNPNRFNNNQYYQWLKNIAILLDNSIKVTVLITLTEDLFKSNIKNVLEDLDIISNSYFIGVQFEQFVQSTTQLVELADDFMVQMYDNWNYKFDNLIALKYKDGNLNFCNSIMTLLPNGELKSGCPQVEKSQILNNCFECKYNKVCKPCVKQTNCTFLKRFYQKVNALCQ